MSVLQTSEAALPVQRSDHQLLRDLIVAQDLFVQPPRIVTVNGLALDNKKFYAIRVLQNCGTNVVYWQIGSEASANVFHGVLKACTAADDGTGGVVDLSRLRGAIYVFSVSGTHRVATLQCVAPEGASAAAGNP